MLILVACTLLCFSKFIPSQLILLLSSLSRAVPSAVFSQPPIGQVGLTEEQVGEFCSV